MSLQDTLKEYRSRKSRVLNYDLNTHILLLVFRVFSPVSPYIPGAPPPTPPATALVKDRRFPVANPASHLYLTCSPLSDHHAA